jgi:hypothetical protein
VWLDQLKIVAKKGELAWGRVKKLVRAAAMLVCSNIDSLEKRNILLGALRCALRETRRLHTK